MKVAKSGSENSKERQDNDAVQVEQIFDTLDAKDINIKLSCSTGKTPNTWKEVTSKTLESGITK